MMYTSLVEDNEALNKRVAELEAERDRLREALGEVYDLWIEDADPQEFDQDWHLRVRAVLEGE